MTLGKKQNKKLKAKIKAVKRRVRKSKKVKSLKQKAFGLDQMLFKVLFWGPYSADLDIENNNF